MTKSELIEIISAKQKHLPAKDIELAVKQMLEIMSPRRFARSARACNVDGWLGRSSSSTE